MNNNKEIEDILKRGVDEVIEEDSLRKKLKSGKKLRIKFGIDPTSPDLHLGHSIPLLKLSQFQKLGHKVILLIGDFTATIGDPSGRTEQRKMLEEKEIKRNMKDYVKQASKILNIRKTEIKYNSHCYKKKGAMLIANLTSKFTYARIIERDDFKRRIKDDVDVSMLELIYPLLQGYDSVELKADVEIGGRDQKFNLLMGRKVQRRYGIKEQDIITVPLLEGIDGVRKMGKSHNNYIALNDSPSEMYGKFMSIPDEIVWKYVNLLTTISSDQIQELKDKVLKGSLSLKNIKGIVALEVIERYYSKKEAEKAENDFEKVFKENKIPENIPEIKINERSLNVLDLLVKAKIAESKSEARRLVEQKGVKINGKIESDWRKEIEIKSKMVVQAGKRKFAKIV